MFKSASARIPRISLICLLAAGTAACTTPRNASTEASRQVIEAADLDVEVNPVYTMAMRFAGNGEHAAAIPLFRQAIREEPMDWQPRLALAESLLVLGEYDEAIEVLDGAQKHSDDDYIDPRILAGRGKAYLALGRPDLASENLALATQRGAGADAYANYGVALAALGRSASAMDAFENGLSQDPSHVGLRTNKGLAEVFAGDVDAGVALLEDVARDAASGPQHRQNLALAYVMAGDMDRARKVASIDLGAKEVDATLRHFQWLVVMEPQARMAALVSGTRTPSKLSLDEVANRELEGQEGMKEAAIDRLLNEPVEEVADLPDIPPLDDGEGWAVQVAAYRTADELRRGVQILWDAYGGIIGDLEPRRSEVDFGDRTDYPNGFFYRLNAGPLEDFAQAKAVCDQLHARGADCWIRPPEPTEGRLPEGAERSYYVPPTGGSTTPPPASTLRDDETEEYDAEEPAPVAEDEGSAPMTEEEVNDWLGITDDDASGAVADDAAFGEGDSDAADDEFAEDGDLFEPDDTESIDGEQDLTDEEIDENFQNIEDNLARFRIQDLEGSDSGVRQDNIDEFLEEAYEFQGQLDDPGQQERLQDAIDRAERLRDEADQDEDDFRRDPDDFE